MENDNKISKASAPHSYATAPFARTNLSSAAATSLLHRRGLGRSNTNIPSINTGHIPSISPRSIKPLLSPTLGSARSDTSEESKSIKSPTSSSSLSPLSLFHSSSNSPLPDFGMKSPTINNNCSKLLLNKWDPKNPSVLDETAAGVLPATTIKDEKQAKKNDRILQERIMEAKSMNPKAQPGATVHKFTLWSGLKNQNPSSEASTSTLSTVAKSELPIFSMPAAKLRESEIKSPPSTESPIDAIFPKSSKLRGPKIAIEKQDHYNMDFSTDAVSSKLAHLQVVSEKLASLELTASGHVLKSIDSIPSSRNTTPRRESRPDRSEIIPDDRFVYNSDNVSHSDKEKSKHHSSGNSSRLTSSLRNKIDHATKAAGSSDVSDHYANFAGDEASSKMYESSSKKSERKSKKSKKDKEPAISSSSSNSHTHSDSMNSYRDDDMEDDCISLGSIEEEEESILKSRPTSEQSTDERSGVGRPPLPGIRLHPSSSDPTSSTSSTGHKSGNMHRHQSNNQLPSSSMPAVRRSLGSSQSPSPILSSSPDLQLSSIHDKISISLLNSDISPPPVSKLKQRQYSDEKVRKSHESANRDYYSAPGSPRNSMSPKSSNPDGILSYEQHHHITPKNAFRSRATSACTSESVDSLSMLCKVNDSNEFDGCDLESGGVSLIGMNAKDDKNITIRSDDGVGSSSSFAFMPIKDTPPDSRSHSIFLPSNSLLSLTLQSIDSESTPWNPHIRSHDSDDKKHYHQPPHGLAASTSSPDYGNDAFESPSPTLSVMSHMSEQDPHDRYEQLVYSKSNVTSTNASPQPPPKQQQQPSSNPFASSKPVSSNPFASMKPAPSLNPNSNYPTVAYDNKITHTNLTMNMNSHDKHAGSDAVLIPSRRLEFNATVPFSEDDNSGYSEVIYVGANGQNKIRWQKGQPIGEGTFGRVFKGMNESTGELAAVKQLGIGNGTEAEIDGIGREIQVMWQLNQENIVRYLGTSRSDRYLFIVLEYISGGSIASMLQQFGSFSESLIRKFSCHIICGVEYLHNKGIVHRDIKGGNVLVTDTGIAKIADFGCSKQLAGLCTTSLEESLKTIRGSVPWMAPEVIKQAGHGRSSDIWSVGATVIEMATGKPPWSEFSNNLAALFHVATSKEPPPIPPHLSRSCSMFLSKCMMVEPSKRATASALLLNDDFLRSELEQQRRSRSSPVEPSSAI